MLIDIGHWEWYNPIENIRFAGADLEKMDSLQPEEYYFQKGAYTHGEVTDRLYL